MMNQEIKAEWVAALRSGNYAQGTSRLHAEEDGQDTFCCLGVLCDIAAQRGVVGSTRFKACGCGSYECGLNYYEYDSETGYLPPSVQEWAGLESANPAVLHFDGTTELSDLNDREGLNFKQIADLIEAYL